MADHHGRPRMGNDARGTGDREQLPAEQAALTARLHRLGERLDRIRPEAPAEQAQAAPPGADSSAMARGFRLSSELVAGVLVGAAIGWLLYRWLGILPGGDDRFSAARIRRRGAQRDAGSGRGSAQPDGPAFLEGMTP